MTSEERKMMQDDFLAMRGLAGANLCKMCQGYGTILYGSTATWHGGIGGAAMTTDVCNKCWGSGNAERPWPSHREFYSMKRSKA